MHSPSSTLRQLADIISSATNEIESKFGQSQLQYPSLDDDAPFDPSSSAEALARSPEVARAALLIVAACGQLSAQVKLPAQTLYESASCFHLSSCIRVACQGNIPEILREAGSQGLHTVDIARKTGLDPWKQARILRLLATHHIFRETSPDVFTNNRLSSAMDTRKSVEEIKASPEEKHVGASGLTALLETSSDEMLKGSAVMTETLFNCHADATDDDALPMQALSGPSKTYWEWLEEPGNRLRHKRFGAAMAGGSQMDPADSILRVAARGVSDEALPGFDWSQLPNGSVIVDVGAGIGSTTIQIAKAYPTLQYVLQDRMATIEDAEEFWNRTAPHMLKEKRVTLQVHDFFTPQPRKDATVFLLRKIIHDYSRLKATKILQLLRDAASPGTTLILVEQVLPYACPDSQEYQDSVVGSQQPAPPSPLLPNYGKGKALDYISDLQMYVALNGEERTIGSFAGIMRDSGWKLRRVFTIPGSWNKHLIAEPLQD